MNKSTKILACLSTALLLGGGGIGTYYGMRYNHLYNDHQAYVQESTLRDEENAQKITSLESQVNGLNMSISQKESQLSNLVHTYNNTKNQNEQLSNQISALEKEIQELESEKEELEHELEYYNPSDASTYTNLIFSYDTSNKTASVKGNNAVGDVSIPAKVVYNDEIYTITELEPEAFRKDDSSGYNNDLTSIYIPKTVTKIGMRCFYGNQQLTSLEIPDGVTEIPILMAVNCIMLSSVKLPDSIETIGQMAFGATPSLNEINVPANLKKIDAQAFMHSHIARLDIELILEIPSSVEIDASAFQESNIIIKRV